MRLILKNLGLLSAVLIALTVGLASPSGAATRFVDATTGSDALNDCLSAASPCQTITYTLTQAVPNDTISVAAGTYDTALGETFPLVIAVNLTLTGAGQGSCGSPGVTCIDAVGTNRVITVNGGVTATISGVTVTGGSVSCTNSGGFSCVAQGGGLFNSGTLTLTNSTVSGNTVSCSGSCTAAGSGLWSQGTATLTATIIAKQLLGSDCFAFFFTSITSNGFNLDSDNTCNLTGTGDQPGVTNPLLGPLANNGGPTQTQALLTGSPAIDAVTSGCPPPATDQRGVSRPQGPHCDIGAYELVQTNAAIPTLSEWAQLAMLTLLFGGGLFALRRRVHPA